MSTLGFRQPKEYGQQDGVGYGWTTQDRDTSSPFTLISSVGQELVMELHRIIGVEIERHMRKDQQTMTARDIDMPRRISR